MEENILFEKLSENVKELNNIENGISVLELELYQRVVQKLRKEKINELLEYFKGQAKWYGQNFSKFQKKIDVNQKNFENLIDKLINVYDQFYIYLFKVRQSAMSNQKIAVANIVTLNHRMKVMEDYVQRDKLETNQIIGAKKKLDYAVIVEECTARIDWLKHEIKKDFEEIFSSHTKQLQVYEESIFVKIEKMFFNLFRGKNRFEAWLKHWKKEEWKKKKEKATYKILELTATLKGIEKQMEIVRNIKVAE